MVVGNRLNQSASRRLIDTVGLCAWLAVINDGLPGAFVVWAS